MGNMITFKLVLTLTKETCKIARIQTNLGLMKAENETFSKSAMIISADISIVSKIKMVEIEFSKRKLKMIISG